MKVDVKLRGAFTTQSRISRSLEMKYGIKKGTSSIILSIKKRQGCKDNYPIIVFSKNKQHTANHKKTFYTPLKSNIIPLPYIYTSE